MYHSFQANTAAPRRLAPPLGCDAQVHVFGPIERYPLCPGAVYQQPRADFQALRRMHKTLGIERSLLVQPTTYGTDHRALLDGLAEGGQACRGCAVIDDTLSARDLRDLHEAGVRGARFNFFTPLRAVPDAASFRRSIARITELGWFAKLNLDPDSLETQSDLFDKLTLPVIIDHFGRADFAAGPRGATARRVVQALGRGNVWVMLSNGHKLSKAGQPWDDVLPIARAYMDAAPDRILWGSDWPHPLSSAVVPDDAQLLDLLFRMVPDESERNLVLVKNPARLFGWVDGLLNNTKPGSR